MTGRLEGKVAIITGAGSGMGRAAARLFAAQGAKVVGCDIDAERGQAVAEEIAATGGIAVATQSLDPSEPDQAQAMIDFAFASFGRIDVLCNHAGVVHFSPIEGMTYEMWRDTMKGDLDIVFNACKAAWPHLKVRGGSICCCRPKTDQQTGVNPAEY